MWSLKISGCRKIVRVLPRHPSQIRPLAFDRHGLLIIPIHWYASSLCLFSTNKLVDAAHWWWMKRFPLVCKAVWVPRKTQYKCHKFLWILIIRSSVWLKWWVGPVMFCLTPKEFIRSVNCVAVLATATLAMLMGYKLIANSGNQNKTSDNKALWLFCCRMR